PEVFEQRWDGMITRYNLQDNKWLSDISKGTRRIKSAAEIGKAKTIARSNGKVPFKRHTCSPCGGKGHNKATCKGCSACGKPVDDEDECDNEDEFDDEDEGDIEDELADKDVS
nr:FAR1 DNA binding domain-containing protein [Tanacetum cinerariifolium]